MPNSRLSMRKIKDVLRLHFDRDLSARQIGQSLGISHNTATQYLRRFQAAGLGWPLPSDLSEAELENLLFPSLPPSSVKRPEPSWANIHMELKRRGVTLLLLWEEYKAEHPDGLQYSSFCDHYRTYVGKLKPSMRQTHLAGEKAFIDYAGQTLPIQDPRSGEVREAQIFVAVLGASNYTFAEATWTQGLPDWIGSHVRAFAFFGGAPHLLVPDNLRSGVNKACRYEPDINPTYDDMAAHYGSAVIPARVRKPKDKAKVEVGVQVVERWILARLRNRIFLSLHEANLAIAALVADLNSRPFKKLPGSRREAFETLDKPALLPLPCAAYVFAEWKQATVNIDYHVEVDGHYYSVPCSLIKKRVDVRITATSVECFHKGQRVSVHPRSMQKGRHTTVMEHMPKSHQEYTGWTPERIMEWARKLGPNVSALTEAIMDSRKHPVQGYRSCLGVIRLAKEHGASRLDAACERALHLGALSRKSLKSILQTGLDRLPLPIHNAQQTSIHHDNVRGPEYYRKEASC